MLQQFKLSYMQKINWLDLNQKFYQLVIVAMNNLCNQQSMSSYEPIYFPKEINVESFIFWRVVLHSAFQMSIKMCLKYAWWGKISLKLLFFQIKQ